MSADVVIVDSGGANIASLRCALQRLGLEPRLSAIADEIRQASHVILPGVGTAKDAMQRLASMALDETLKQLKQPVLGICLGMQLLAAHSEEDATDCLGLTPDTARLMRHNTQHPVPHMGWNRVQHDQQSPLLNGIDNGGYFYFVHSYALPISESTIGRSDYTMPFSAVIQRNNFFGTQFHPERSAAAGARLLANFLEL